MGNLKNRCVIIGGGDCDIHILNNHITSDDYIICADSGYDITKKANITPDLIIGDFDSVKSALYEKNTIKLPIEKDVTDSVAAYFEAIKLGFDSFVMFGGTGGRFEHTYANISLMANASKSGIKFEILDNNHIFRCITNSSLKIKKKDNQQVSVFAYGDIANGVTLTGFHYPLSNYSLDPFNGALGTSNDIIDDFGIISVESGTLVIIETQL